MLNSLILGIMEETLEELISSCEGGGVEVEGVAMAAGKDD